jgi:GNAT superfamily N-acetyltransferase
MKRRASESHLSSNPDGEMSTPANTRKKLLAHLDEEFVTLRGRKLSLGKRYPELFGSDGCADFHWLTEGKGPVSMLVTRPMQFAVKDEAWKGVMIGWVHTLRTHQGKGLAGALLHAVAQRMADEGADFMLLWAHQHAYYRAQGYQVADATMLAEAPTAGLLPSSDIKAEILTPGELTPADHQRLQGLADGDERGGMPFNLREPGRTPLPFEKITLALAGKRDAPDAYVLLGHQPHWTTVLEGSGDEAALSGLVATQSRHAANIRVNARRGSALHRSLANALPWVAKPLAMYLPLSRRFETADLLYEATGWSFPYIDRM